MTTLAVLHENLGTPVQKSVSLREDKDGYTYSVDTLPLLPIIGFHDDKRIMNLNRNLIPGEVESFLICL